MQRNAYTREFLEIIEKMDIEGSIIKELKTITIDIPDIQEFSLLSKCEIALKDLEEKNEKEILMSKTCQILKIACNLNDKLEMKQIISKLIEF